MKKIPYTIYRPGGNDTALIIGTIPSAENRKSINDQIMQSNPSIEQVGFLDPDQRELMMAGGEFCGNATRSAAYALLDGKTGTVSLKVSGVQKNLSAGVDKSGNVWANMPIQREFRYITYIDATTDLVEMEGISHLVVHDQKYAQLSEEQLKIQALDLLQKNSLTKIVPAAGVMFVNIKDGRYSLRPVVWVRDIQSLFYETACGSGTTAVGLQQAKRQRRDVNLEVTQPSGLPITININVSNRTIVSAQISGPIQKIKETYVTQ